MINMPIARTNQAPLNEIDEIKTPKQHARDFFLWLDQVALDPDLPPSAFKVAYVIGQHVNRQSGEAWPSTDTIADRAGLAQSSVRDMIERLHQRGHLEVTWGRRGRGHPNRYRLITKERTTAVLEPTKERTAAVLDDGAKERFRQIKERSGTVKERRSAMNHFNNNLSNNLERPYGPRSEYVDRAVIEPTRTTSDDVPPNPASDTAPAAAVIPATKRETPIGARLERRAAFKKIKGCYPQNRVGGDDENSFAAFELALDVGNDLADMVEDAKDTACVASEGDEVPELAEFFLRKCWTEASALH